ncbi:hypothetical protein KF728_29590 [Candidatus Obscuribacterales bacterium]|nr:hypothetical protein [Candidatus Obscuribacterales bacterium]MBX3154342.1 hypothetical protein [Candidatus Obscuribacterales bacterium]
MKIQPTQAEKKLAAKQNIDESMLVLLKEATESPIFTDEQKVLTTWFSKPTPRPPRDLFPFGGTSRGTICAMPPHCIEAENILNSALKYLVNPFRCAETIRSVRKVLRPFGFSTYCLRHQELRIDNNPKSVNMKTQHKQEWVTASITYHFDKQVAEVRRKVDIAVVLDTTDPLEFIELFANAALKNSERTILSLNKWNQKYGIEIIGVGYKRVEFFLKTVPREQRRFIKELAEISSTVYENEPQVVRAIQEKLLLSAELI